ncbi:biotin--[acetyl-CoA-carboxylase] ligase [Nocardioides rubriscoriae]|uniref:biotin--[acetyl-CoA-carboxylase] ligase n=1 Tax=Nocardioides rubriscoriae TaxID=642762 RepID=UPI001FE7C6BE|nr:biotin--[acetyl-CoA-carboxylase] ligase [Nocardioides rubriscoriae]
MTPDSAVRPPLDKARLGSDNPELMPDLTVEVVDTLESTNAEVARRAQEGAPDGLVVVADHQTAGRGRLDRTWESPAGTSVTFSILLRPHTPTRAWPWLPLLTGYAVDKALQAAGLEAGVKWPNDVLVGDKKVAGILVERVETPEGPAAVVGVGINVGLTPDELPVDTATSIEIELGRPVDRTDVLVEVLTAVREAVDAWEMGGDPSGMRLHESYAAACVTVGRDVRVDLPDGSVLEGRAVAIDPAGQLVVESDGVRTPVSAGDVVHVRAV